MADKVSFRWSTRREGNDGYVLEEHIDRYGDVVHRTETKMAANIVPAYVEGRRRIVATKALEHDATYVEPDYDFLNDPDAKPPPGGLIQ